MVSMCGTIGNLLRLVTVVLCSSALLFQTVNTISCNFVSNSSDNNVNLDLDQGNITSSATTANNVAATTVPKINYGLWKMGLDDSSCFAETKGYGYEHDRSLNGARISHILSMVGGAVALLLISVECIKCRIVCGKKLQGFALFFAWVTGLCVFMVFGMKGCGNVDSDLEFDLFDAAPDDDNDGNSTSTTTTGLESVTEPWENFNHIDHNTIMNYTSNIVSRTQYLESLASRFGSRCEWQEGASYNLVATLLYFMCGLLLCCTPEANPCFGSKQSSSSIRKDNEEGTNLSGTNDWTDLELKTEQPNAKIV